MSAPPIPPVVWQRIAAFLAAGHTGQIVLDVKQGRVLAYKLTESGRVDSAGASANGVQLDNIADRPQDCSRTN